MNRKLSSKVRSVFLYVLYILLIIGVCDVVVLKRIYDYGFWKGFAVQYPIPYVGFRGQSDFSDNNKDGFRGPLVSEVKPGDLKIAFFGGSTGYSGRSTIAQIVEKELEKLTGKSVFVANYSVISSNHRQNLHGIIEYLP